MNERGSVTIMMATLLGVCALLAVGLSLVGVHLVALRRAQTAADAAALAGADQLAVGAPCDAARSAVGQIADEHRVRVVGFACDGVGVVVSVQLGSPIIVMRRARAIVDPCARCGPSPGARSE